MNLETNITLQWAEYGADATVPDSEEALQSSCPRLECNTLLRVVEV
jgi:hypothetical protein